MSKPERDCELPGWGWLLICLGALLVFAIVLIFLWPWLAAFS
jgi:hypothetical protein